MVVERSGLLSIGGNDVTILGEDINVGQTAPAFMADTQSWEPIDVLKATKGKVRIIAAVPSLETSVCDRETRRFNEEAAGLSEDVVIVTISTDLPYTQARWCGAAGIEQVMVVSDHKDTDFGLKYGCLVKERRVLRRAVFIVDAADIVRYVAYMPALANEPDYAEVLALAKELVG